MFKRIKNNNLLSEIFWDDDKDKRILVTEYGVCNLKEYVSFRN